MSALRRLCRASILVFALATPSLAQQPSFHWESDVDAAKLLAAKTNRLVLIHFWAPWCPPCMRLEEQVFNNPAFGPSIAGQYVAVKLNYDQSKKLADQFAIQSIPADVILSPQGQLIQKSQSPQGMKEYVGTLQQIAARAATPPGAPPPTAVAAVGGTGYAPPASPATTDNRYADYYNRGQAPAAAPSAPAYAAQAPAAAPPTVPPASVAAQAPPPQSPWVPPAPTVGGPPAVAAPPAGTPPAAAAGGALVASAANPNGAQAPLSPGQYMPPNNAAASAGGPPPTGGAAPPIAAANLQLPPGCPALGLDGYCAVTLIEQRNWKAGDPHYGAIHRNRTYIFAGPAEQQRFLANPDAYSPVMSGDDPVLVLDQNRAVPGLRKHGVFFGNRVYLFSSEQTLAEFARNPNRYSPEITQARLRSDGRQ